MATKSFCEQVVVKDQKSVSKMEQNLKNYKSTGFSSKSGASCTAKETVDNSKKWNI